MLRNLSSKSLTLNRLITLPNSCVVQIASCTTDGGKSGVFIQSKRIFMKRSNSALNLLSTIVIRGDKIDALKSVPEFIEALEKCLHCIVKMTHIKCIRCGSSSGALNAFVQSGITVVFNRLHVSCKRSNRFLSRVRVLKRVIKSSMTAFCARILLEDSDFVVDSEEDGIDTNTFLRTCI